LFKALRYACAMAVFAGAAIAAFAQTPPGVIGTGTWTPLTHQPTFGGAVVPLLMTDGSVMVQDCNNYDTGVMTNHWWKLTPDATGSYINGTWSQLADADPTYGPLFYASAVLPDGKVLVEGGEYNMGVNNWTTQGSIYDPSVNAWTNVAPPAGWPLIGDAQCVVLPNGKLMLAQILDGRTAMFDEATLSWTPNVITGKVDRNDEEGWTLLPDGTVLTVDCTAEPNTEKWISTLPGWVTAGSTPQVLTSEALGEEMGAAVLRFDGTVMQFGANNHTAIYTPPAISTDPGSWAAGPDMPNGYGQADSAACLLPNGRILMACSPGLFNGPCAFYETDGVSYYPVPATAHSPGEPSFIVNFLVLPNGQVMSTDSSNYVEIYTPVGGPSDAWRPTITASPAEVSASTDYTISGTQFNGLSQTNAYGDDWTNATNYPIVRITNNATGHVFYCRTHDHSTMGVATGAATVSTHFTVPAGIESGDSTIVVVANGIPSASQPIFVGSPTISSLSPNTTASGGAAFTLTVNGDGFVSGAKVDWFDSSNNETQLTPDTLSGTQITVTIPASLIVSVDTDTVKVENPNNFISNGLSFTVTQANHPPTANAGADQTVEMTGPSGASVTLNGSGSTDPDSDPLTYTWSESGSTIATGVGPTLTLAKGVHTITLTVDDGKGGTDTDDVQITVQDTTAPAFGTLPDITVPPTSNAGAIVTFGPFYATDLVDGSILGTPSPASGSTFAPGSTLVTVSATDTSTNTGYGYFHVNVLYQWSGFLSPLPKQQIKKGSSLPIKFALTGASAGITNLQATGYWETVINGIVGPDHTIGTFVYNAATGQYQLNWKTPTTKGTYQIKVTFGDGSVHTIQVILK